MTDKKYFKTMLFAIAGLFLITCFSVIFCVINIKNVDDSQNTSHIMSIVYLIFQLIMEGIVFYYAFKAMISGSSLVKAVMYVKEGVINKKSKRNALIIMILSAGLAIYFLLTILLDIFLSFLALGLRFAIMNLFCFIAVIAVFFFCYRINEEVK